MHDILRYLAMWRYIVNWGVNSGLKRMPDEELVPGLFVRRDTFFKCVRTCGCEFLSTVKVRSPDITQTVVLIVVVISCVSIFNFGYRQTLRQTRAIHTSVTDCVHKIDEAISYIICRDFCS